MRLEWLRYFDEVVQSGSITKAAHNLYATQPAITKTIQALENEVGEVLLGRSSTGVVLTEQGEIFLRFARLTLDNYGAYLAEKETVKKNVSDFQGTIELAIAPLLLQSYYKAITQAVKQWFPKVDLCVVEAAPNGILYLIEANPHTLGFAILPFNDEQPWALPVVAKEIMQSRLMVCTSALSEYAKMDPMVLTDIPLNKFISLEIAKQPQLNFAPMGRSNFYTTNLEMVRQKLTADKDVCVSLPKFVVDKAFSATDVVQLGALSTCESVFATFMYHSQAVEQGIYNMDFLKAFQQVLQKVLQED